MKSVYNMLKFNKKTKFCNSTRKSLFQSNRKIDDYNFFAVQFFILRGFTKMTSKIILHNGNRVFEIDKKIWHFTFDDNEILKKENQEYFDNLKLEYQSMGEVYYQRFILRTLGFSRADLYTNNLRIILKCL